MRLIGRTAQSFYWMSNLVNGEMENWVGHWLNKRKIPLKEESQVLFSRNLKKKKKKEKENCQLFDFDLKGHLWIEQPQ